MKKIIVVIAGVIVCFGGVVGYGQEKTDTQKTAQSQENKTFDKPLDKRVEEAVSGMETYSREIQKEIEPIQDSKKRQKTFFSKLHEYLTKYVRDGSIKELLALEAQILKKGEGPDSIYGWFWGSVHNTVLNLAGYDLDGDTPLSEKVLEIIQDDGVDDYVRSKYIIDVRGRLTNLHNKGIEVDEKVKEKIYPVLVKIIDDTNSSSELRAEAATTLVSIGRKNSEVTDYIVKILDDKDDLVKDRIIWYCDLKNNKFRKKIISMLANRGSYSKKVTDRIQRALTRWPSETSEAIPYLVEILKDVKDKEEFERLALNLQEYNDSNVMEPIIQKIKELGLKSDREISYYLKNSLLLDYLSQAKNEDKVLILRFIHETSCQMIGDVYTPPHFDKAITILKDYISIPNSEMQIKTIQIYGEIIEMAESLSNEMVRKEAVSELSGIKKIILDSRNRIKDSVVTIELDSLLRKIEKIEKQNQQTDKK